MSHNQVSIEDGIARCECGETRGYAKLDDPEYPDYPIIFVAQCPRVCPACGDEIEPTDEEVREGRDRFHASCQAAVTRMRSLNLPMVP